MLFGRYVAGVSSGDRVAQIAVLKVSGRSARLCHLLELRSESDSPVWFFDPLFQRKEKIFKKVRKVSVAVDPAKLYHYTVPVDSHLNPEQRKEHVRWELSQILPQESRDEYISDHHLLRHNEHADDVLLVAIRRDYVVTLENELKNHKISCGIIDSAFIAAQASALASYPELRDHRTELAGIYHNRIDAGILSEGKLADFHSTSISSSSEVISTLESHGRDWSPDSVCVYGMNVSLQLLENLKSRLGKDVFLLDSFKSLDIALDRRTSQQFLGREHLFAPAIGIALMKS